MASTRRSGMRFSRIASLLFYLPVIVACMAPNPGYSQEADPAVLNSGEELSPDTRLFYRIYGISNPVAVRFFKLSDASSYFVFLGAGPASFAGTRLGSKPYDWEAPYRLSLAEVTTTLSIVGLKRWVRRSRPYRLRDDIVDRRKTAKADSMATSRRITFSFPSGHAALSFALVSSWSLSHPEWYIILPGAVWAVGVALSRVWLGVHYPGDILAGALLGTGIAFAIHYLADTITPSFLRQDENVRALPKIRLRILL